MVFGQAMFVSELLCLCAGEEYGGLAESEGGTRSSPVQNPHVFATGQGCSEFVCLIYQSGIPELFPGKVPLFLATKRNGVAVNSRPKVGVDPGEGQSGAEHQWKVGKGAASDWPGALFSPRGS